VSVEAAGFALHEVARRRGLAEVGCLFLLREDGLHEDWSGDPRGLYPWMWDLDRLMRGLSPQAARHLRALRGRDEKKTSKKLIENKCVVFSLIYN